MAPPSCLLRVAWCAARRAVVVAARASAAGAALSACGPIARIPPSPTRPPGEEVVARTPSLPTAVEAERLARTLAPVLYRQADEPFALERVVAVLHPRRRVIAYHLLWRDDAHGAWIPGTIPTDEEVVWVGYDATGAPGDVWTYWHGAIVHTAWGPRQVAIDVQWGKHGSLPRGARVDALPWDRTLNAFYAFTFLLPDYWLSNLNRRGPWCFCGSYRRYRAFTDPLLLTDRLDAVVVAVDPRPMLRRVFGTPYSEKPWWPWRLDLDEVRGVT